MKKILIISYFFPPCARSGVNRVLHMAKYLVGFDWEPIFLTVHNGYWGRSHREDAKLNDIVGPFKKYKTHYFYPFKKGSMMIFQRLIRRLWDETILPDGYVTWIPFAVNKGINIIRSDKPDIIFVTGSPFSSFLIGYFLKIRTGLPLLLDYRDPWITGSLNSKVIKANASRFIENKILKRADIVFAATRAMVEYIINNRNEIYASKFRVFHYSYSITDCKNKPPKISYHNKFTITFAGAGSSSPEDFLNSLRILLNKHPDLENKIEFRSYGSLIGEMDEVKCSNIIKELNLKSIVKRYKYLPREKLMSKLTGSHLLLLPYSIDEITKITYPGKMFDYFKARRPILYIGPKGHTWETIQKTESGLCVNPNDHHGIARAIIKMYNKYYLEMEKFIPRDDVLKNFQSKYVIGNFVKDVEELFKNS